MKIVIRNFIKWLTPIKPIEVKISSAYRFDSIPEHNKYVFDYLKNNYRTDVLVFKWDICESLNADSSSPKDRYVDVIQPLFDMTNMFGLTKDEAFHVWTYWLDCVFMETAKNGKDDIYFYAIQKRKIVDKGLRHLMYSNTPPNTDCTNYILEKLILVMREL